MNLRPENESSLFRTDLVRCAETVEFPTLNHLRASKFKSCNGYLDCDYLIYCDCHCHCDCFVLKNSNSLKKGFCTHFCDCDSYSFINHNCPLFCHLMQALRASLSVQYLPFSYSFWKNFPNNRLTSLLWVWCALSAKFMCESTFAVRSLHLPVKPSQYGDAVNITGLFYY